MVLLLVPLAYATIICHLTVSQATEIVTTMNETVAGKKMDKMMQLDVSRWMSGLRSRFHYHFLS